MSRKAMFMRDFLIEGIYQRMFHNRDIFFLSADFGAPVLDRLRSTFADRFINVGIAEQNLINIATGLALEGFTVYAYGIAPFISMRAYEQIRIDLSLMSHTHDVNVNLIAVGAGLSYDFTGPTHHCLEDLAIMRVLPNMTLFSPADTVTIEKFIDHSIEVRSPKYIRLDGKLLPDIYAGPDTVPLERGFQEIVSGRDLCFVATGFMTHKAMKMAAMLKDTGVDAGVIDMFLLKPFDEGLLSQALSRYPAIVTLEEAFATGGGLGSLVLDVAAAKGISVPVYKFGLKDRYSFEIGDRDFLHEEHGVTEKDILGLIENVALNKEA